MMHELPGCPGGVRRRLFLVFIDAFALLCFFAEKMGDRFITFSPPFAILFFFLYWVLFDGAFRSFSL